jgi:hypothetical protein
MKIESSSAPWIRTLTKTLPLLAMFPVLLATTPVNAASAPRPVERHAKPAKVMAAPAAPAPVAPVAVPAVTQTAPTRTTTAALHDPKGLSPAALSAALDAVSQARARGISGRDDLLTVIDYSLPSTQPRLWVLDLAHGEVLFHELVAHGAGTGDNYAARFSNTMDSRQTSLGLFLTGGTYEGGNGYSLRLRGLDKGVNDLAEARSIVMHGAWYVSNEQIHSQGRLGRSWGCPALSQNIAPRVIDTIKGGSFIYSYYGHGHSAPRTVPVSSRASSTASVAASTTALVASTVAH